MATLSRRTIPRPGSSLTLAGIPGHGNFCDQYFIVPAGLGEKVLYRTSKDAHLFLGVPGALRRAPSLPMVPPDNSDRSPPTARRRWPGKRHCLESRHQSRIDLWGQVIQPFRARSPGTPTSDQVGNNLDELSSGGQFRNPRGSAWLYPVNHALIKVGQKEMTTQHPAESFPIRALAWGAPDDAELAHFPLEERILMKLPQQPWSSSSDLAKRLKVSDSDLYKAVRELEKEKMISGRELGVTRRKQRRYVLTGLGVRHVTKPCEYRGRVRAALPLTWQMTEEGARRMMNWLPMIESLYEVLPTFWTGGLAAPFQWQSMYPDPSCSSYRWLGIPTLMEIRWLPRGRLHAMAIWRFDREGTQSQYRAIPFLWSGLLPQQDFRSRSLRLGSEYIRCARDPDGHIWWDIEPTVAAIGVDEFAAFRARNAYGDDVQVGSVDTTGALVWSADASHSEWTVADKPPRARSVGHPEVASIEEGPDLVNLGGIREYRVFAFLSEFRAATRANLATACRMSRGAINTVWDHLLERELVTSVEGHSYVTERGLAVVAARDRVEVSRLVEVTYVDPEGEDAKKERRHDAAVAAAAAKFLGAGIPVVAGWRWIIPMADGQLVPDLWLRLPVPGRDEGAWVPAELEFSAKTPRRIERKLRSYLLAPIRLDKTFPVVVITGEALAARHFDDLAGDLPVLTTTLKEFLTGVWEGPESVWRRNDRPQGLSDFARERHSHLRQQTGRSLDYSEPSCDFSKFLREESLWSDPYSDWGDGGGAYVDLELLKRTLLEQNKARVEHSAAQSPPVPIPPTTDPAPVEKALTDEDLSRGRRLMLGKLNWLLPLAAEIVADRLKLGDVSNTERLCLMRVNAIITFGLLRHSLGEIGVAQELARRYLILRDEHRQAIRSEKFLRILSISPTETNPREAFKNALKEHPKARRDACKIFDNWSKMMDAAGRTGRRARTLEPDSPAGNSAGQSH